MKPETEINFMFPLGLIRLFITRFCFSSGLFYKFLRLGFNICFPYRVHAFLLKKKKKKKISRVYYLFILNMCFLRGKLFRG